MKAECDKLSEEQTRAEEGREQLRRRYQLLKQDLEKKVGAQLLVHWHGDTCMHTWGHALVGMAARMGSHMHGGTRTPMH